MAFRIANIGKTGILKVKKSNAEQLKYRPDLGDVDLDISSESKTTTTGQFSTITGGLMESCVINLEPVQSGSGTPSPDNVRLITGHSSVEVGNTGRNVLPMTLADIKTANTDGTWSGNVYTVNNVKYTLLLDGNSNITGVNVDGTASSNATFYFVNKVKRFVSLGDYIFTGISGGSSGFFMRTTTLDSNEAVIARYNITTGTSVTVPITSDVAKISSFVQVTSGTLVSNKTVYPMMRVSTDEDNTFEPYIGYDVAIALGQTVYGGSVDVVSGVLTVDKGYVDLGSLTWYKDTSKTFYAVVPNSKAGLQDMNCEVLEPYPNAYYISQYSDYPDNIIARADSNTSKYVYVKCTTYENGDATAFKTAMSGHKLVYVLETPIIIQLTPQQINTLIGENHLDVPLEGQSLDSAVYRELFAWDDVDDTFANKSYNKDYLKSKNLINQDGKNTNNGYVHDAYISNQGSVMSASGTYDVLEYVEVKPSTTYTISGINGNTANGFAEYDSDKTMIAHDVISSSASKTFTTTSNTKYVRFNRNYSNEFFVQLEEGSDATAYTPYVYSNVDLDALKADKSSIGTDESGRTTASQAYAIGEHFYKDGKFGKTKVSVAQGATWTLDTNYEETTIAEVVKTLNQAVTPKIQTVTVNGIFIYGVLYGSLFILSFADGAFVNDLDSNNTVCHLSDFNQLFTANSKFFTNTDNIDSLSKTVRIRSHQTGTAITLNTHLTSGGGIRGTIVTVVTV